MTKYQKVRLPFGGFYESQADALTDDFIEGHCSDELKEEIHASPHWNDLHKNYAKQYAQEFIAHMEWIGDIDIEWDIRKGVELRSPREYNFETDTIDVWISTDSIKAIYDYVEYDCLSKVIKDRFTARDEFIPFYSDDLEEWSEDVTEWDCIEIETLILAYFETVGESVPGDFYLFDGKSEVIQELILGLVKDQKIECNDDLFDLVKELKLK